jgi:cyclase
MTNKSAYRKGGMFDGASPIVFQYAKDLRKSMTAAELSLWGHLKQGIKGYKFRRQHPIGDYIADIYCHKLRLIIEVDGSVHNQPETKLLDHQKEIDLKELGYSVIRFSNDEVLKNLEAVLKKVSILVDVDIENHTNNQK